MDESSLTRRVSVRCAHRGQGGADHSITSAARGVDAERAGAVFARRASELEHPFFAFVHRRDSVGSALPGHSSSTVFGENFPDFHQTFGVWQIVLGES